MDKKTLNILLISFICLVALIILVPSIFTSALILFLIFFVFFRNDYTYKVGRQCDELIDSYANDLIEKRKYDMERNYFSEMQLGYFEYFFKFWLWGVNNYIRPQYRDLLKEYNSNKIKNVKKIV